jgi:hypothetical protein
MVKVVKNERVTFITILQFVISVRDCPIKQHCSCLSPALHPIKVILKQHISCDAVILQKSGALS